MSFGEEEYGTIIGDVTARHSALVDLINRKEDQALTLLQFFTTIELAAVAGIAACFSHSGSPVWMAIAGALVVAIAVLALGSVFCLVVLRPAMISLPGREPDFWKWALNEGQSRLSVLQHYLDQLEEAIGKNVLRNGRSAVALMGAKACAATAPVAGLLVFWHYG